MRLAAAGTKCAGGQFQVQLDVKGVGSQPMTKNHLMKSRDQFGQLQCKQYHLYIFKRRMFDDYSVQTYAEWKSFGNEKLDQSTLAVFGAANTTFVKGL